MLYAFRRNSTHYHITLFTLLLLCNTFTIAIDMFELLQLLSYHRRLRMISEALELLVECGRVNNTLCMYAVSDSYGGLAGSEMEVVDCMLVGQCLGVGRMSGNLVT